MGRWASRPPAMALRRLFANLRYFENQTGVQSLIRYFGCLEYGETYGRPHYHLIMYNQSRSYLEPIPRKNGTPSSHYHLKFWPYGHVDVGTVTKASIRYVSSYMTKESYLNKPILFRTSRPGIGFYGISNLAEEAVNKLGNSVVLPTYFQIGERKYGLDNYVRNTFKDAVLRLGGRVRQPEPREKVVQRVLLDQAKIETGHHKKAAQKAQQIEDRVSVEEAKKQAREIEISSRYDKIKADSVLTLRANPALATATCRFVDEDGHVR